MVTANESLLDLILNDPIRRIEGLLRVPTKNVPPQLVPFKLTRIQRDYLEKIMEWRRAGHELGRYRVTVKPRQVKMSSVIQARNYTDTMLTPNMNTLVMAQDDDTKSVFRTRAQQHWKDFDQLDIAPVRSRDNEYEMEFGDLNSRIVFRTATDRGGRAYTFHRVHLSEVGFYDNGPEVLAAVWPSLAPDAEIDVESTSSGPSGLFHSLAKAAQKQQGWELMFYPWWWEDDYVADPAEYIDGELEIYEQMLVDEHGLSLPQIAFRRKIRKVWETLGPDAPPVEREYAETIESAFTAGGNSVFRSNELYIIKKMTREPIKQDGDLWIWQDPVPGMGYVIGADVAAGGATTDNSAATVINEKGIQVAGFYGKQPAVEFASTLNALAHRYNAAYLVPEGWPGEGSVTCAILAENFHYPKLHFSEMGGLPRPGFITNAQTRQELVRAILEAIKYQLIWINDERLYEELAGLVWYARREQPGARRKLQAGSDSHDDYAISLGLAAKFIHMAIPANRRVQSKRAPWGGF